MLVMEVPHSHVATSFPVAMSQTTALPETVAAQTKVPSENTSRALWMGSKSVLMRGRTEGQEEASTLLLGGSSSQAGDSCYRGFPQSARNQRLHMIHQQGVM